MSNERRLGTGRLTALSLMALPVAFVSLPLYVLLPNRYATQFAVPLAALGAVLLAIRALDALLDPWLGQRCDAWFAHGTAHVWRRCGALATALVLSFAGLWLPDASLQLLGVAATPMAVLVWATPCLVLAYVAATLLNLCLQSWGTRVGGDVVQRSRISAAREGWGLAGVVLASTLPAADAQGLAGASGLVWALAALLALSWWLWRFAPLLAAPVSSQTAALNASSAAQPSTAPVQPAQPSAHMAARADWLRPLRNAGFRALLQVFMLNGIASAIPATLVMFFIQDRLQIPASQAALYLGLYFVAAALSLPLWLRGVRRWGLAPSWLKGQGLSVLAFVGASVLGAGDAALFAAVCVASGMALGADLVVPGALLTGVIARHGDAAQAEGRYLGWWQVATKLNLALAAGLALPALQWFGYRSNTPSPEGLVALSVAYGVVPCVLKLAAAWRLWTLKEQLWEKSNDD